MNSEQRGGGTSSPSSRSSGAGLWARIRAAVPPWLSKAWPTVRWFLKRGFALLGTLVLLLLLMTAGAAWYTSRPEFCRSCHIMEPYYKSWAESSHKDVSCIECHFAPGLGGKARGKLLGLVQLAKYVTQSAGPRPAAEIPDASCLRSGCHETRLLSGRVQFHGVTFDHTHHLEADARDADSKDADAENEEEEGPINQTSKKLFKLRCTSCHSQIVQGKHMAVTTSTCFLCHFKEQRFNKGLGACTRCHQIPSKEFDLGGGVVFTHDLAYERGVDCAACHGDLIRGAGEVPRERCLVCHNRPDDLEKITKKRFMHRKHVSDHKIDCLECHLEIKHSLDKEKLEHAAANCASCHPNHHTEQVNMLKGMGAKSVPVQEGGMTTVRIECSTCHKTRQVSATGTVLWKASVEVCRNCHDDASSARLATYEQELKASLKQMEAAMEKISAAAGKPEDRKPALNEEIQTLQTDLVFLRTANGAHNVHYASTVTSTLSERIAALGKQLKVDLPQIKLPHNAQIGKPAKAETLKPTKAKPGEKSTKK